MSDHEFKLDDDSVQSLGGKARAEKLSKSEKSEIARTAAEARWSKDPNRIRFPKATHAAPLKIGDAKVDVAVLDDGTRVISQGSFLRALGRSRSPSAGQGSTTLHRFIEESEGVEEMPPFMPSNNLKPFISKDLMLSKNPIAYKPLGGGRIAFGYKAEILPMVCYAYIDAGKAGVIHKSQSHILKAAELIVRGLATVGI